VGLLLPGRRSSLPPARMRILIEFSCLLGAAVVLTTAAPTQTSHVLSADNGGNPDDKCEGLIDLVAWCESWKAQGFCTKPSYAAKCQATCNDCEHLPEAYYVDAVNGNDYSSGLDTANAFETINKAIGMYGDRDDGCTIYVADGTYSNQGYGSGNKNNGPAVQFNNQWGIKLVNLAGHHPKILFDGSAGISIMHSVYIEVMGFEIEGPNTKITLAEAEADRLLHSAYFSGRGIFLISSSQIHLSKNEVHNCPNSGIRSNFGDYITIEDNHVYDNTWYSSNAESAIVISDSRPVDDKIEFKMIVRHNLVHGNINQVSYYNSNYDDPQYLINNQMHVARENYGSVAQTFIIDGSGVYMTRNSNSYKTGLFLLEYNTAFRNGINGLVVHKTDNAVVRHNILYDNGQVSRDPPHSRQLNAGLTINHGHNCTGYNNTVFATAPNYAYSIDDGSYLMTDVDETTGQGTYQYVVDDVTTKADEPAPDDEAALPNWLCGSGVINADFDDVATIGGQTECTIEGAPPYTPAPSPPPPSPPGLACAELWGKCGGGSDYVGPTCCAAGDCRVMSDQYSQCRP